MNNRIGTLLNKEEKDNLPLIRNINFKVGEIVAYEESHDTFRWVLIRDINANGKVTILNGNETQEIGIFRLNKYLESETIKQTTKNGINYDSNFTIETYKLD